MSDDKEFCHSRQKDGDDFEVPHRREADRLIESLLSKLVETHSILGELSGKVDSGLNALNNKIDIHTTAEERLKSDFNKDFTEFKQDVSHRLEQLDKVVKDLQPFIEESRNKAMIWMWATEKVPRAITNMYKVVFFVGAVLATSWAFIEFIIQNKLGK